jgi:predicted exporter
MARVLLPSDRTPDKISGPDLPGALARKLVGLWRTVGSGTASVVVLSSSMILIVVLLVFGLSSLQFNDNLEQLAQIPDELKENDRYIRNATGIKNTGRYILVEAASKEQLLQRQEEIRQQLDELKSANAFDGYWGLLPFLPSQRRQKQNLKLIEGSLLSQSEQLRTALRDVGYRSDINDELVSTLKTTVRNEQVLTVDEWLNHPASFGLRQLWLGCSDGRCSSLIILKQIRNEQRIEQTFESLDFAHYRNRKRAFERVMRQYRVRSITLASAAYGIILLFLLLRYGLRMGLLMFLPSVLGTFITISSLSLFGVEFHLMHVLAVLIILGMGIDYTIFLVEEAEQDQSIQPTMVALILSALTTVLSFGCLAFSQAAVIHSIGLIVFPGILLILLLSPMVCMMFPDEH